MNPRVSQRMVSSLIRFRFFFFFSSRRRHTRYWRDWSSDVCSSDLRVLPAWPAGIGRATFPPCPARLATVGPRSGCRGRRHRPARSAPAAPIGAGFGHGGPEMRAARALPRSESMAASVSRCASKILLHLRRTGYELVHIFLGQDTSSLWLKSASNCFNKVLYVGEPWL